MGNKPCSKLKKNTYALGICVSMPLFFITIHYKLNLEKPITNSSKETYKFPKPTTFVPEKQKR